MGHYIYHKTKKIEMAFSRIVPMTRRDFFWDDPFFSNVWDDFEKMRTDIWKGHEDFFGRFNQQEKALQNEAESFMNKNSKNESRIIEKSMKKSSSKFEKDFYLPLQMLLIQILEEPEVGSCQKDFLMKISQIF